MKKQENICKCMQKYVKRAAAVFMIGCMVTGLATGCSTNGKSKGSQASLLKEQTREVFAMDTYMTLKAYGKNAGKAFEKYPLAFALNVADMEASYYMDDKMELEIEKD